MKSRTGRGATCCYCRRGPLHASTAPGKLAFTRDHINPQAAGGGRWVPCCRQCNQLKGSLSAPHWFWFIDAHPLYWRHFKNHAQVHGAIGAEIARRARAGEPPIANVLLGSERSSLPIRGTWNG